MSTLISGLPKARLCRARRIRGHAHFVYLNALAHTHPVYGFLSTLCLYFSYHSGHTRPYVGIVSHRKIDVYVRLSSATTAQAAAKRILSRRFVCTNAVPVHIICIFLCVSADSETKNTAQAHWQRIQSRALVGESAVPVHIISNSARRAE